MPQERLRRPSQPIEMNEPDPLLGTSIGNYELVACIGSGSMGDIYLGQHPVINRRVAIKILRPDSGRRPELVQRFRSEALLISQISHPNVVSILDFGATEKGQLYFTMEFLEGRSLEAMLVRNQPFQLLRGLSILTQVTQGLEAAHLRGVIHRDLKPANIFLLQRNALSTTEHVKILDFGVAKLLDVAASDVEARLFRTDWGSIVGTPAYMSPEQCSGEELDLRCDLYALGVIAYEMFTGELPFRADTLGKLLDKHRYSLPVPPRNKNPKISVELNELILCCLEKAPSARPADAGELLRLLHQIAETEEQQSVTHHSIVPLGEYAPELPSSMTRRAEALVSEENFLGEELRSKKNPYQELSELPERPPEPREENDAPMVVPKLANIPIPPAPAQLPATELRAILSGLPTTMGHMAAFSEQEAVLPPTKTDVEFPKQEDSEAHTSIRIEAPPQSIAVAAGYFEENSEAHTSVRIDLQPSPSVEEAYSVRTEKPQLDNSEEYTSVRIEQPQSEVFSEDQSAEYTSVRIDLPSRVADEAEFSDSIELTSIRIDAESGAVPKPAQPPRLDLPLPQSLSSLHGASSEEDYEEIDWMEPNSRQVAPLGTSSQQFRAAMPAESIAIRARSLPGQARPTLAGNQEIPKELLQEELLVQDVHDVDTVPPQGRASNRPIEPQSTAQSLPASPSPVSWPLASSAVPPQIPLAPKPEPSLVSVRQDEKKPMPPKVDPMSPAEGRLQHLFHAPAEQSSSINLAEVRQKNLQQRFLVLAILGGAALAALLVLVVLPLFAPEPVPASLPTVRPVRSVALVDLSTRGNQTKETKPAATVPVASAAVVVATSQPAPQPVRFVISSVEGCPTEVQMVSSLGEFPTRRMKMGELIEAPFRRDLSLRFEADGFVSQTIQVTDRVQGSELSICLEKITVVVAPQLPPKPIVVRSAPKVAPKPVVKSPKPVVKAAKPVAKVAPKPTPAPEPVKPKDGKKTANNSLD